MNVGEPILVGHVAEIWRYPAKSMQGQRLSAIGVSEHGLEGDRRFAVIDIETGRVASAKNPRKWAALLSVRVELRDGVLFLIMPDGVERRSDCDDLDSALSQLLGRAVTLRASPLAAAAIEVEWPDVPGLANANSRSVEGLPTGNYFDLAPVHLLTTATLRQFCKLHPSCDFDRRRFRPNIVINTLPEFNDFVENSWVGRTVLVGEMALRVTAPCSRCVMTTLAQPGLDSAPPVLRAVVNHNAAIAGAYGCTARSGKIEQGNAVWLD